MGKPEIANITRDKHVLTQKRWWCGI